jgi:hypothetical protein
MPKTKPPKRKRGPNEDRLIIKDPQGAIDSLFKPTLKKV